jgi:hypothetical protein
MGGKKCVKRGDKFMKRQKPLLVDLKVKTIIRLELFKAISYPRRVLQVVVSVIINSGQTSKRGHEFSNVYPRIWDSVAVLFQLLRIFGNFSEEDPDCSIRI